MLHEQGSQFQTVAMLLILIKVAAYQQTQCLPSVYGMPRHESNISQNHCRPHVQLS